MRRDTRFALLDVAQERFAIDGFAGTSVRDLATAVGIKESSVYNHFSSKQAVLDAVLARIDERLMAVARRFGVPLGDPKNAVPVYKMITLEQCIYRSTAATCRCNGLIFRMIARSFLFFNSVSI